MSKYPYKVNINGEHLLKSDGRYRETEGWHALGFRTPWTVRGRQSSTEALTFYCQKFLLLWILSIQVLRVVSAYWKCTHGQLCCATCKTIV